MLPSDKKYSTFEPVAQSTEHPYESAGFLSKFFFGWTKPLMQLGNKRQLAPEDLWRLQDENKVQPLTKQFREVYERNNRGILKSFFSIYWCRFIAIGFMQFFTIMCSLYGPGFVLGQVIQAVEAPELDMKYVLMLIGSLYAAQIASAFVQSHLTFMNEVIGIQFSSALRSMLFEKALLLSAKSKREKTAGDVANLFSVDTINVMSFAGSIHQMWIVPLQIGFVLYLLYTIIGWSIFVGLGAVFVILVINGFFAVLMGSEQERCFKLKDNRMKVVNEVFGAIQIIKFNAWEEKFADKIRQLRHTEYSSVRKLLYTILILITFMNCTPIIVTVVVFATFTMWMKQTLTVAIVFSTLALFKSLQDALINLPIVITSMVQSLVSAKRINDVLTMEECDPANIATPSDPIAATYAKDQIVLAIDNGSFGWDEQNTIFNNINLKVKKGELVVIHGAVGQGKSSLCSILLGEMDKTNGTVFVGGQVAYFAQQSWIQNTTIRENILFGHPYDRTKYNKIIDACALTKDLQSLPAGDRTEIGQKGINLSGGQKARISLARACYSDADIYLLDSPLSAVDAIVASEIFSKCILGLLKHKTVLLVTHNPEIIESKEVDRTILVQDGQLIESTNDSPRTVQESLVSPLKNRRGYWETKDEAVIQYAPVTNYSNQVLISPSISSPYHFNARDMLFTPIEDNGDNSYDEAGRLIQEEERAEGRVSKAVVLSYLDFIGGTTTVVVVLFLTLGMQVLKVGSDLWLTYWSNSSNQEDYATFTKSSNKNMLIYAGLALGSCLLVGVQAYSIITYCLRGSQKMFDTMLNNLLEAPMRFFDANPIGRILNRFGDDVAACDFNLSLSFGPIVFETSSALFTLGTTLVMTQWAGLAILPLLYLYYRLGKFFLEPLREVNRIQKTTRSPLISFVSEGIDGSSTIRAFGDKQLRRFYRVNCQKIETFCESRFANSAINVWFSMRIQLLSSTIVVMILLALAFLHDSLSTGMIGLLITYGLSIPANLMYLVNMWSQLETSMISPERIQEYARVE
ncbi:ATP-binding Cassette (ABC) Superfamily, partial [Thraustotheca clavata]